MIAWAKRQKQTQSAPRVAASIDLEARLEVVEDGRIVLSRPVFVATTPPVQGEPLRDITADLKTGQQLGAGGFVAIDFETATSSRDSACAVAVAAIDDGRVTNGQKWLIRPPNNQYDGFNIAIHGITPEMTADSPSVATVWSEVLDWVDGRSVVAHYAPFDLSVVRHSLSRVGSD